MTVIDPDPVIEEALTILEDRGWTQGIAENKDGRVCMMGALNIACGVDPWDRPSYAIPPLEEAKERVVHVIADRDHTKPYAPMWHIATWNDTTGRTFDEVRDVLKAAMVRP